MLVQTVLAWARDQGAKEIWLEMRESNMRAIGLYQRCGFTTAGRRPGYYVDPTEDALLMRCRIECGSGDAPV
jgi:ribosomal-protein-alanine N-acetyltransferase